MRDMTDVVTYNMTVCQSDTTLKGCRPLFVFAFFVGLSVCLSAGLLAKYRTDLL